MFLKSLTYDEFLQSLRERMKREKHRDLLTQLRDWRFQPMRFLIDAHKKTFTITNLSINQLLKRFSYPKDLFDRFPLSLQEETLNYLLATSEDRALFRLKHENTIRAVLSTHYTPMDDVTVFQLLHPHLKKSRLAFACLTETETYARFFLYRKKIEDIPVICGCAVKNSETGNATLTLCPTVYLKPFGITIFSRKNLLEIRHVGSINKIKHQTSDFHHKLKHNQEKILSVLKHANINTSQVKSVFKDLKLHFHQNRITLLNLIKTISLALKGQPFKIRMATEEQISSLCDWR